MILNYFNQRMPQQHEGKVAEMQNQVHMIAVCRFSGAAEGQVNNIVATPGTCTSTPHLNPGNTGQAGGGCHWSIITSPLQSSGTTQPAQIGSIKMWSTVKNLPSWFHCVDISTCFLSQPQLNNENKKWFQIAYIIVTRNVYLMLTGWSRYAKIICTQ